MPTDDTPNRKEASSVFTVRITIVDLKRDMVSIIKAVQNTEYQTLLELRYLCFKTWEQIAVAMGYNLRHVYRLHDEAVESIKVPQTCH